MSQRHLSADYLPDEETLQKIADLTGGRYYRADNVEKFKQFYREIDKLEKSEAVINKYTEYKELFPWIVVGGLALLLLELVLGQTAFRRLPMIFNCRLLIADCRLRVADGVGADVGKETLSVARGSQRTDGDHGGLAQNCRRQIGPSAAERRPSAIGNQQLAIGNLL